MSENIFLIWNGWGIFFTVLLILDSILSRVFTIKIGSGTPLKRILIWVVTIPSIILTFILCNLILGIIIWPISMITGAFLLVILEKLRIYKE